MSNIQHFITEEFTEEMREVFRLFDKDGGGSISIAEMRQTLEMLGHKPLQIEMEEMMNDIDVNGDGEVDFEEFMALMIKKTKNPDSTEDIKEMFFMIDTDKKGYITAPELYRTIKAYGEKSSPEETVEMFKAIAAKQQDKITYEEFVHMVRNMLK